MVKKEDIPDIIIFGKDKDFFLNIYDVYVYNWKCEIDIALHPHLLKPQKYRFMPYC